MNESGSRVEREEEQNNESRKLVDGVAMCPGAGRYTVGSYRAR